MNFARTLGPIAFLAILLTPATLLLRAWATALVDPSAPAAGALAWLAYAAILVALLAALVGAAWGLREAMRVTGGWETFGLADLDNGLRVAWSQRLWLLVAAAAVAVAVLVGDPRPYAVVEAAVASLAVLLGVAGRLPIPPRPVPVDPAPTPPAPLPAPGEAPGTPPVDPGHKWLRFSWFFSPDPSRRSRRPEPHDISLAADLERYRTAQAAPHEVSSEQDYVRFVRDGVTPEVEQLAGALRAMTQSRGYSRLAEINNVLAFVQSLQYLPDTADGKPVEYPKYPLETLVDDGGDCEDHAILAAACLRRLGYDARLVVVDYGTDRGHMALAVEAPHDLPEGFALKDESGRKFYYCAVATDATTRSPHAVAFTLGEIPERERAAALRMLGA